MKRNNLYLIGTIYFLSSLFLFIATLNLGDYSVSLYSNLTGYSGLYYNFNFSYSAIVFLISIYFVFNNELIYAIIFGLFECAIFLFGYSISFLIPFIDQLNVLFLPFYITLVINLLINLLLVMEKIRQRSIDKSLIKKKILQLGTQYTQVEIREICEECNIDKPAIKNIVINMINNQEIYGEYYSSTKSISFNQKANIDEIDSLMAKYKEWETQKISKK